MRLIGTAERGMQMMIQSAISRRAFDKLIAQHGSFLSDVAKEIDHKTMSQEGTIEGIVQLHSAMACLQVHIFLSGLDPEFDQARGEILRKDPKLDLESTYAYVRREYQQRQTMGSSPLVSESSALLTSQNRHGPPHASSKNQNFSTSKKSSNLICSHCGETGHSKQRCYEIIGYPDWWDFSKKPRKKTLGKGTVATATTTEEQSQPTANVAHEGTIGYHNSEDSWLWC
ncbi:hypothetical protein CDL12_08261 [Handroanthus impetiginosus]|uniref:CCHC-type domain-containing protein n=1 Tax=Handroanthus impetiginosus TaxID=429701 RepID=A0A2G9HNH2_9LAMI|nr:hypothetical protein CDL12_08261 [Handroanthus impetiginosus]